MGAHVNLLRSLPVGVRDVSARRAERTPEVVRIARQYGREYFDGDRKYGYGGYRYDGRWRPVARDILGYYFPDFPGVAGPPLENVASPRILDVGCAKGFLVKDLCDAGADAYGLDVSSYAVRQEPHPSVASRLHLGDAVSLPFPDDSFDLVLSINTIHNLPQDGIIRALREMRRVSRGRMFVQVDSYHTPEERALFEDWVLTAEWTGYPEEWLALFAEAGYDGDYSFTVLEGGLVSEQPIPHQVGEPRDALAIASRANWNRVPDLLRQDCISSLRDWLPNPVVARFREEYAAGLRVGSTIPMFHFFSGGMATRNRLRSVLLDEELPEVEYRDGGKYRNWDDFYLGVIEEMVEQIEAEEGK